MATQILDPTYFARRRNEFESPTDADFEALDSEFNLNPAPRSGQGPYGLVPGSQGLPNPAADLAARFPNLDQSNAQLSRNILSELMGELTPEEISNIQDEGARFGISSGIPGSDLVRRRSLRNIGAATGARQRQGLEDYLGATAGISRTQTLDPALKANIAAYNAILNAAPDPGAAANEMESRFRRGLNVPGFGSGGGGGPTVNQGVPNLSLGPLMAQPGIPNFGGSTRGTGSGATGVLPVGSVPYAGQPGVNPFTGMPIAQVPSGGGFDASDPFGFGDFDWSTLGGESGIDQSLIDIGSQTPDYNPGQFNPNDPFGLGDEDIWSQLDQFDENDPFGFGDFDWSTLGG